MRKLPIALAGVCLFAAACTLGPNYQRPKVDVPATYRGPVASSPAPPSVESLGNEKWWSVFHDPVLQQLIRTALQHNYDVQIAASRVIQAQAQLSITRSNQYPVVSAGARRAARAQPESQFLLSELRNQYRRIEPLRNLESRFLG